MGVEMVIHVDKSYLYHINVLIMLVFVNLNLT